MASTHSGALVLPLASDVENDPYTRRFWGVDSSATVEVPNHGSVERPVLSFEMAGGVVQMFRYPALWLTEDIMAWYNEYNYNVNLLPYTETNPKFHVARGIYESYLSKFRSKK